MSGGLISPGCTNPVGKSWTTSSAISYPGTLMKITTTADTVDVCGAGEEPFGFTYTDTKDAQTGVAASDVPVSVVPLVNGQVVEIPLLAANAAISIGDRLETTAGGTVDKKSGAGYLVGWALEAKDDTSSDTYIKVLVNLRYASA